MTGQLDRFSVFSRAERGGGDCLAKYFGGILYNGCDINADAADELGLRVPVE